MTYGSTYQKYGARYCANCKKIHKLEDQILETSKSRFKLLQFLLEMSTTVTEESRKGKGHVIVTAGAGQRFMLGVLVAGPITLVAASGKGYKKGAFIDAAKRKKYIICPPRKADLGKNKSIKGTEIPLLKYKACKAEGAGNPGDCAAPRLLQKAFEIEDVMKKRKEWAISEIYYQPNTTKRTAMASYWVHGLTAHSCDTCENLVPVLLCPGA